jgi:hypothetical protein
MKVKKIECFSKEKKKWFDFGSPMQMGESTLCRKFLSSSSQTLISLH